MARSLISTASTSPAPGAGAVSPPLSATHTPQCRAPAPPPKPTSPPASPTSPAIIWANTGSRRSHCWRWRRDLSGLRSLRRGSTRRWTRPAHRPESKRAKAKRGSADSERNVVRSCGVVQLAEQHQRYGRGERAGHEDGAVDRAIILHSETPAHKEREQVHFRALLHADQPHGNRGQCE